GERRFVPVRGQQDVEDGGEESCGRRQYHSSRLARTQLRRQIVPIDPHFRAAIISAAPLMRRPTPPMTSWTTSLREKLRSGTTIVSPGFTFSPSVKGVSLPFGVISFALFRAWAKRVSPPAPET